MPYTQLTVYRTSKPRNSTGIVAEAGLTITSCLIKENVGIIHPKFRIHFNSAEQMLIFTKTRFNYVYWPDVSRYYYIEEITFVNSVVVDIDCAVDVLASFHEDIHNTDAFIMYAESASNSMIPDNRIPMSDRSNQHTIQLPTKFNNVGCFIVTIASDSPTGNTGSVQAYAMQKEELLLLASVLQQKDFADKIQSFFSSPQDAVIDCIWVPLSISDVAEPGASRDMIHVGGWPLTTGTPVMRTVGFEAEIEPYVEYYTEYRDQNGNIVQNYADYRNCEPFSQYLMWLPGAGLTQIPMISLIGTGAEHPKFRVYYSISTTTGEITYTIGRLLDTTPSFGGQFGPETLIIKGNVAVSIPVGKGQTGFGGALMSALAAAGSFVVSALAPEGLVATFAGVTGVENAIKAGLQVHQSSTSATGSIGGWSVLPDYIDKFSVITTVFETADSPANVAATMGRPLFMKKRLGDMKGLVKCTGAYVHATGASDEEQRLIAQYVNSSANFIFGGLIVEESHVTGD